MQDEALLRYSRHLLLDAVGVEGQEKILAAHVLVIGAGGLGCPVGLYLASSGVGHITVVDPDGVELSNLQRQIGHTTARIGQPKAHSLAQSMAAVNPLAHTTPLQVRVDLVWLKAHLAAFDVVVDCCDSFATRQAINAACVALKKPWVMGAAVQMRGQVGVFDPRLAHSPCYACIFPEAVPPEVQPCAQWGVLAPLVGVIGSFQASQVLQLLLNADVATSKSMGQGLVGRLWQLDVARMAWSEVQLARQANCQVCGCF